MDDKSIHTAKFVAKLKKLHAGDIRFWRHACKPNFTGCIMPIYDIRCEDCRYTGEILTIASGSSIVCPSCGSEKISKLMSATSSLTGRTPQRVPGAGDTSCCGSRPDQAGCAGPGSCCGQR